jgi:DNA-directed RNA polymerase subunit K/omega
MSDIKNKVQGLDPNIRARDVHAMANKTANIYETLNVISKRARQLAVDLKHELNTKLEEFAVSSDTIEEITENKEQIEVSKYYERLPKPHSIAMEEWLDDKIYYRHTKENTED